MLGVKHVMTWWWILMVARPRAHTLKSLPHWVIGSQYRTPMCYPVKSLFIVLFYRSIKYKSDPLRVEKSPTEDGCFVISDWGEWELVHLLRTLPGTTETPSKVPTRQPRSRMAPCLMKMPSNIKHTAGDSCYVYWPARLNAKSTSHTSPHSSACEATARACPAEEHISTFAPSLPFWNHVKHVAFGKHPFGTTVLAIWLDY